MKNIIVLIILAGAGYYYYDSQNKNIYSLSQSETKPIPKQYFYGLWDDVALKTCENSKKKYNTTKERCEEDILAKVDACGSKYFNKLPEIISSKSDVKKYGKKYLNCITPYYYCNGIEVKNEYEAKQHCS